MRHAIHVIVLGFGCILLMGAGLGEWAGQGTLSTGFEVDDLAVVSPQLVTYYPVSSSEQYLYQYRYVNGTYENTWVSGTLGDGSAHRLSGSGDIDNDGAPEIYAVVSYVSKSERIDRKTMRYYYRQRLLVFASGVPQGGIPSWGYDDLEGEETTTRAIDCIVADVDADGRHELIVLHASHVDVYDLTGRGLRLKGRSRLFGPSTFSLDVGDADNDGKNEIVIAIFETGAPYILKFDAQGQFAEKLAEPIPSKYYGKGFPSLSLDFARVRDADNLRDIIGTKKGNEIVGGGNNNRLMIWKHNPATGNYDLKFVSADLGGFTQGVDAGDLNGDGANEVVIGNAGTNRVVPYLWLFVYDPSAQNYVLRSKAKLNNGMLSDLEIGHLDADDRAEVAAIAGGLRIFDFVGNDLVTGNLVQAYFNANGSASTEIR